LKLIAHSSSQEISHILWKPKAQYHIQKSSPLVHILSQMNPINTQFYFLKLNFKFFSTMYSYVLRVVSSLRGLQSKSYTHFLPSLCLIYDREFFNHLTFQHPNFWRRLQIMELFIMQCGGSNSLFYFFIYL
jgi:hypothetical protein